MHIIGEWGIRKKVIEYILLMWDTEKLWIITSCVESQWKKESHEKKFRGDSDKIHSV